MQQLWAQVLDITPESIGLDDIFFRLGGDSIGAMKLVGEARKKGVQLSVADLFCHPRLAALASLDMSNSASVAEDIAAISLLGPDISTRQVRKEVATNCSVDTSVVEYLYPCSPLQEGSMSLTSKRTSEYIMQSVLELWADVDEDAFRSAWEQVARYTAVLRTRIAHHSKLACCK